jgi:hypothetical protein
MSLRKGSPLIPDGLAAEGMQGAEAGPCGHCVAKDNLRATTARILARAALEAASAHLAIYALETDAPEPGVVEAADFLDAACAALDGLP